MKTRALTICLILFGTAFSGFGQTKILDGVYIKENVPTRKVIPYTYVREADAMWEIRIWRVLDMKEKMNHPLYYPIEEIQNRKSLFDVIRKGIDEGTITAYGNPVLDDEFNFPLTKTEATEILVEMETILREDDDGELIEDSVPSPITSGDIKRFYLKEVWFFDRERSLLDVRVLGVAPVRERLDEDGVTVRGYQPLFWVYFPEARYVFANEDVFNRQNDSKRLSYDDIFWKRMFSSYIREESNVYERKIQEYKVNGLDQLLEAERIKNKIFLFEHDLWRY